MQKTVGYIRIIKTQRAFFLYVAVFYMKGLAHLMNGALRDGHSYKLPMKKLILNHFGAALLGIMLTSACGLNTFLNVATSVLAAVFYMIINYNAMWDIGAKDRARAEGGRLTYDPFYGLKAALMGNIPNFVLAFLCTAFTALGAFGSIKFFANAAYITNAVARFWNGMYTGILVSIIPHTESGALVQLTGAQSVMYMLLYFAIIIPSLIICPLGYLAGYKGFRIIPEKKKEK